jgi:hypothetical protein
MASPRTALVASLLVGACASHRAPTEGGEPLPAIPGPVLGDGRSVPSESAPHALNPLRPGHFVPQRSIGASAPG